MIRECLFKSKVFRPVIESNIWKLALAGLLIAIMVLITYRRISENGFVHFDDYDYVVYNKLVRNTSDTYLRDLFTTPIRSNYHPLTMLSLKINNNNCNTCPEGISPKPFIRGNVVLHLLNSILVLLFVFLLFERNILISFLVAAIFAVHPMHVEAVAWISARKDVLYTFFFLTGLIAYTGYLKNNLWKNFWLGLSFILFILSCLSKATAVVFPLVLILINLRVYQQDNEKPVVLTIRNAISVKNILILVPFFIVSLFIGLMAYNIQSGQNFMGLLNMDQNPGNVVNNVGNFSILQRIQISSFGFVVYIVKFLFPVNLSALYSYPPAESFSKGIFPIILWTSVAAMILTIIIVFKSIKRTRLIAFGMGFYFVTIVLVLQFISVGSAIIAERYTYLPYVGLALIPVALIAQSSGLKKRVLLILSGCFIIIMMILSSQRISNWKNTETLFPEMINRLPEIENSH